MANTQFQGESVDRPGTIECPRLHVNAFTAISLQSPATGGSVVQ